MDLNHPCFQDNITVYTALPCTAEVFCMDQFPKSASSIRYWC